LSSGAGAAGVRVPDLQRAAFLREAKPSPSRLRRTTAADAELRPAIGLAGATIIAVTVSGFCCALSSRRMLELQKRRLLNLMQPGLAAGKPIQEVMRELDHT